MIGIIPWLAGVAVISMAIALWMSPNGLGRLAALLLARKAYIESGRLAYRDELRERLAMRTGVKLEPLKTKGRIILDFKKPAEAEAALAAVLAIS